MKNKKRLSSILILLIIFGAIGIIILYITIFKDLPSLSRLKPSEIAQTTKILDRKGVLLYEIFAEQNRTLVRLSDLPKYLKEATVAIEDKDFYKHRGVNPVGGILRAIKETVLKQKLQGGSTITQQLVKNALLTNERTIQRKIKELILATWTETVYSKDQILEMYLNQVPYGGTAWGIEAAAETYFGKKAQDLSLSEATYLAGLPAAPTAYSPYGAHPERAKNRQKDVLNRMIADGYISRQEMEIAEGEELNLKPQKTDIKAPHFVMYVKEKLAEKYGEHQVSRGGLKVTTTLDLNLQEMAQQTVASEVADLTKLKVTNGATLIVRPPTGEILAMVGSKDYFATDSGNFNVTTASRQPGSAIKPLNYAVGLETKKVTAATTFLDNPTCFLVAGQKSYCPVNYDGKFHGPQQLRFSLGNSFNIPAVKMMALNNVETVIASASAYGISTFKDPANYGLSLTLGGGEVTMLDMARAFGVFANTGIKRELTSILKIEDHNGHTLENFGDPNLISDINSELNYPSSLLIPGERVLSSETAFLISHILLDNNARSQMFGASSLLNIPKKAVSVKTGTTDDKRDNWTIGYTPNFLTVVWVGNNDNSPMNPYLASGISGAAPIWNTIMKKVLENQPDLWPKQPEGIVGAQICSLSGNAPPNSDPNTADRGCQTRYEYFIKGTIPKDSEVLKRVVTIDKTTNKLASPNQTENIEQQEKQVVSDMFGNFCLDCNHEGDEPVTNIKL